MCQTHTYGSLLQPCVCSKYAWTRAHRREATVYVMVCKHVPRAVYCAGVLCMRCPRAAVIRDCINTPVITAAAAISRLKCVVACMFPPPPWFFIRRGLSVEWLKRSAATRRFQSVHMHEISTSGVKQEGATMSRVSRTTLKTFRVRPPRHATLMHLCPWHACSLSRARAREYGAGQREPG